MFKSLDSLSKFLYLGSILPLFAALFAPLLINSQFLFPYITPKTLFFRIAIEVALFFYLLLIIRRPEFRPKMNKLLLAILIFFGIVTLASLFGVNLYKSFWGNIERGEGLLTIYHVLAFVFMSTQLLKTRSQWLWFLNTSILVSVIGAIYGLMQNLGADVLNTTGSRIASTIGNASFFAGYLLFGIFLSLLLLSKSKAKAAKLIYAAILIFEVYLLIETETRGAFLGLLAGLIIISLIYLAFGKRKSGNKMKKYASAFIIGIVLVSSLIWFQKDSEFVKGIPILRRLTTISFNDITTQSRLLTWNSSWQGLNDRPLLGYGWENYNVAFNKYFNPEIFRDAGSQIWFDRAHNIVFDIAVTSGYLGLVAYGAIFIMALKILYTDFKKNNDLKSAAILTGLLAAYFVQNLFVFDVLATYISFYTLIGFIIFIGYQNSSKPDDSKPRKNTRYAALMPGAAAILLVVFFLGMYNFNIKPAKANLKAVEALIAQNRGEFDVTGDLFHEAIDMNTNQTGEIRQKYAEYAINLGGTNLDQNIKSREFSNAINEIKDNIERYPLDVQYHLFLMILYNRSNHLDNSRLNSLHKVAERALELSPTRPQIYYEIGQAYINQGKFDEGLAAFEKAVDLQPQALESRWNLAAAYILSGQKQKAEQEFQFLEEHGYKYYSLANLRKMINVYNNAEDWESLADVYEALTELEPTNPGWYAQLAATYQRMGQTQKALEAVDRAVEIQPDLAAQADNFIRELGIDPIATTSTNNNE